MSPSWFKAVGQNNFWVQMQASAGIPADEPDRTRIAPDLKRPVTRKRRKAPQCPAKGEEIALIITPSPADVQKEGRSFDGQTPDFYLVCKAYAAKLASNHSFNGMSIVFVTDMQ